MKNILKSKGFGKSTLSRILLWCTMTKYDHPKAIFRRSSRFGLNYAGPGPTPARLFERLGDFHEDNLRVSFNKTDT
jgi:hypothetical protein